MKKAKQDRPGVGDKAPDFKFESPWGKERKYYEITGKKPSVLVFLRYIGCPVCQLAMVEIKRDINLIKKKRASLFVVLQSSSANIASVTKKGDWPFTIISDPEGHLFKQYGVEPGGILKYLHPAGLITATKAIVKGHRHGKFEGKETQLPAVFIVSPDKTITYAYYGRHISDIPSPGIIAENIK